jgi:hypothetical protein
VVIDGRVHRSEGIRPARSARADELHLEDFQADWNLPSLGGFGLVRSFPGMFNSTCLIPVLTFDLLT